MADARITVPGGAAQYENQDAYTITDSDRATVDMTITVTGGSAVSFSFTYAAAAPVNATLVRTAPAVSLPLVPPPAPFEGGGWRVSVSLAALGADSVLSLTFEPLSGTVTGDWTVRIHGLGGAQLVYQKDPLGNLSDVLNVKRVLCDAHAGLVGAPATALENASPLTLTANPARVTGAGPPNAALFVNHIGTPTPQERYRWTYTGPAPIMDFADVTTVNTKAITLPSGAGSPTVQLVVQAWLTDDATLPTPASVPGTADLPKTSAPHALTIMQRPQRLLIVLDRTGSMDGDKWTNAKTATQIMVHLFSAIRKGENPGDRVAVLVFEDPDCSWHSGTGPSGTIQDVLALTDPAAADTAACTIPFGPVGVCTSIGDALTKAYTELTFGLAGADLTNTRFTALLVTDGIENAGVYRIDPSTPLYGGSALSYVLPTNLVLCTVGVGSDVNNGVLNQLAGPNVFHAVDNITDAAKLTKSITQCGLYLFDANEVKIASDPASFVPPGDADPAAAADKANAAYIRVNAGERKLAFAMQWGASGSSADAILFAKRDGKTGAFTPVAVTPKNCGTYGFAAVDLATLFGGPVPETEWRVVHASGGPGGAHVAGLTDRLLAWADLRAKADHVFDKQEYRTGEPMKITVRLRDGDQPVTGAKVSVALRRPQRSLGDFLARNSGSVLKTGGGVLTTGPLTHDLDTHLRFGAPDASAKSALLDAILQSRGESDIGYEEPPGIFADGTNDLHDTEGTGNYSNVYTQTNKEGAVSFVFEADGTLADGSGFSRIVSVSKWIGVNVDPLLSDVTVVYNQPAPTGYLAAQVIYTPIDRFGNLLGPFRAAELTFRTTAGVFTGEVVSELDGTYHQTLLYRKEDGVPIVTVETQGKSSIPIPIARGCLAALLRPLLWLLRLILHIFRRP
jgi:hypothetical protein